MGSDMYLMNVLIIIIIIMIIFNFHRHIFVTSDNRPRILVKFENQ